MGDAGNCQLHGKQVEVKKNMFKISQNWTLNIDNSIIRLPLTPNSTLKYSQRLEINIDYN